MNRDDDERLATREPWRRCRKRGGSGCPWGQEPCDNCEVVERPSAPANPGAGERLALADPIETMAHAAWYDWTWDMSDPNEPTPLWETENESHKNYWRKYAGVMLHALQFNGLTLSTSAALRSAPANPGAGEPGREDDLVWLRGQIFALHEDTIERYHETGQKDLEGKEGAYARGRCVEAKSIARSVGDVVHSRLAARTTGTQAPVGEDVAGLVERLRHPNLVQTSDGFDLCYLSATTAMDEAADALTRLSADLAACTQALEAAVRERDRWKLSYEVASKHYDAQYALREAAEARLAEAVEVIRPFAKMAASFVGPDRGRLIPDDFLGVPLPEIGDLRRAAAFLARETTPPSTEGST